MNGAAPAGPGAQAVPYKVSKSKGGYKVTSPNHPQGFSKKPQSKAQAEAQMRAIRANTKGK